MTKFFNQGLNGFLGKITKAFELPGGSRKEFQPQRQMHFLGGNRFSFQEPPSFFQRARRAVSHRSHLRHTSGSGFGDIANVYGNDRAAFEQVSGVGEISSVHLVSIPARTGQSTTEPLVPGTKTALSSPGAGICISAKPVQILPSSGPTLLPETFFASADTSLASTF